MTGATAWILGSMAVTGAVQYDQAKSAKFQGKKALDAQSAAASADLRIKEQMAADQRAAAERSAQLAEEQAAEVSSRAEEAKREAAESAKQSAIQKSTQVNLDQARDQANELARAGRESESTQAPDIQVASADADRPATRKRKTFSSASSAIRI